MPLANRTSAVQEGPGLALAYGALLLALVVFVGCADPAADPPAAVRPPSEAAVTTARPATTDEPRAERPAVATALPPGPDGPPAPTRTPESIATADAMWETFQAALRARDRDALSRLVADTLNPHVDTGDGWVLSRETPEHGRVIDDLLGDATREALLAIDRLDHEARFSAARYDRPQDDGRLVVGYGFEEVAPGDWRLVTVGTQWSR